jgi:hypothetical protein
MACDEAAVDESYSGLVFIYELVKLYHFSISLIKVLGAKKTYHIKRVCTSVKVALV